MRKASEVLSAEEQALMDNEPPCKHCGAPIKRTDHGIFTVSPPIEGTAMDPGYQEPAELGYAAHRHCHVEHLARQN